MRITRRGLGALAVAASVPAGLRVASLDYGLAQTALALEAELVGLPDPADYRAWVVTPGLPDGVRDLGGRTQPNLEVLRSVAPGVILAIQDHAPIAALLRTIAPVLELPIYTAARDPWERSEAAARAIGARLGRPAAAERLIGTVATRFTEDRARLAAQARRPVLLGSFADPRHLVLYAEGSILDASLRRLGLRNAWTGATGRWGTVTVPVERLAGLGEAALFLIEPLPADLADVLERSPLWRALPFVREGRVRTLPPVLMFGTLPAAERFASVLVPALLDGAADV